MSKESNDIVRQWEEQKQMEKGGDPTLKRIVELLSGKSKEKKPKKKPKKKK